MKSGMMVEFDTELTEDETHPVEHGLSGYEVGLPMNFNSVCREGSIAAVRRTGSHLGDLCLRSVASVSIPKPTESGPFGSPRFKDSAKNQ